MEKDLNVKEKAKTLVIIVIVLIILVIGLVGYIIYDKINNPKGVLESDITNNQVETNIIKNTAVADNNYKWEEYPDDIDKNNFEWIYGTKEYNIENNIKNSVKYNLMKKTIYSLSKKYNNISNCEFEFLDYLGIGDSTKIIDWDSNYSRYRYPDNEKNDLSAKYTRKIEYKTAVFNEMYYDGYYNLETCVKNQYDKLSLNKEYTQEKLYYKITKILVMNGNNESENTYKNNARAKKIKVTINNDHEYIINLKDTNEVQIFDLIYTQNTIEKPVDITIEVIEKYEGEKSKDVYISDIQFAIDSNIPQGR